MKTSTPFTFVAMLGVALCFPTLLQAQPLLDIETVTISDAGNSNDINGYGAVTNVYAIGKYEVTLSQYATFLNAVAATDTYNLYNTNMTNATIGGISRSGSSGSYTYSVIGPAGITPVGAGNSGNRPVTFVSWFDAARFCNWLHNGATNGASTENGAYTLNGATAGLIILKNPNARWWIPSENEWYKAAYYDPSPSGPADGYWLYPTRSDSAPGNALGVGANQANYNDGEFSVTQKGFISSGQNYLTDIGAYTASASYYGTYDQGGNVSELNDAVIAWSRGERGGCWNSLEGELRSSNRGTQPPGVENTDTGFRLATLPAPTTNIVIAVEKALSLTGTWEVDQEINAGKMTNTMPAYQLKIGLVTTASNITNTILTMEKSSSATRHWQTEREINVGPMTKTNEFYRLKIRTVVE